MYLSKEYIKMCEKSNLGNHIWRGDFFVFKKDDYDKIHLLILDHEQDGIYHFSEGAKSTSLENLVQVYRIDQLIKMIINGETELNPFYANEFRLFLDDSPKKFESYEINWLMFVMKEKFNKSWDGETWI
jgi:hypothetical protein